MKIKKNSLTGSWESSRGRCRAHYLFDCGPNWKRPLADCSLHCLLPQLKEERFPTTWQQPSQWATMILRTLHFLQLMFCLGQPSQLHLFLCKRASSPLLSGLVYGFAVACMFKLQFSAMPKSFFFWPVKLIDIFIFKVHNSTDINYQSDPSKAWIGSYQSLAQVSPGTSSLCWIFSICSHAIPSHQEISLPSDWLG